MFQKRVPRSSMGSAFATAEIIYHTTVRSVRKTHTNALMSIALSVLQTVILVGFFWLMFTVLGMRGMAIRGDFVLYLLTGVSLYMLHTKTVTAVMGAAKPDAPMMQHLTMNTAIAIAAAALGALYVQVLGMLVVLYGWHVLGSPIVIHDMPGAAGMVILAWFSGLGVGLVFAGLSPFLPQIASTGSTIYNRLTMIASGKMFVANTLPGYMLAWFDWHPLFHAIDQARGYAFVNYFPHHSDWSYALYLAMALLTLGIMGEFHARRSASASWRARR